ncbi:MAG: outer membrane protein assembly factor BamE [Candidatus Krumholzibacteriota bacterium]|nr:outer membrane protein assembly factor BamE [Candidatus Krumholzibacteriota bacterium]
MTCSTHRAIRHLLPLLLLLALTGCRQSLRAPVAIDPEIEQLRRQYASSNQNDPFLENMDRSEVRRGMNPTQVFLAWGRPLYRVKSEHQQRWTYEFREGPLPQPRTLIYLFFRDTRLVEWQVDRGHVFFSDPDTPRESRDDFGDLPGLNTGKQPDG